MISIFNRMENPSRTLREVFPRYFGKLVEVFFTFLDWTVYLSLLGVSFSITWDVMDKFGSKATNIRQYEELITMRPIITFCFISGSLKYSKYGEDFNIHYKVKDKDGVSGGDNYFTPVKFGENGHQNATVKLFLKTTATLYNGLCYQLNTTIVDKSSIANNWNQIKIISVSKALPKMEFYFTSGENSYGVVKGDWRNGEVLKIEIKRGNFKKIDLNVQKHVFLKSTTKCSDHTFYECLTTYVMRGNFTGCPKECIPCSLPNQSFVPCDFEERKKYAKYKCNRDIIKDIWQGIINSNICPRTCTTTEYSGKVGYEVLTAYSEKKLILEYKFVEPAITKVHEEYVLFDTIDMICSVGGNLGLFIGFSISNVFTVLFGYLQLLLVKIYNRRSNTINIGANIQHEENSNFAEDST